MAEFCLACWNEINGTDDTEADYVLSRELELCEGCGRWKRVVEARRRRNPLTRLFFRLRDSCLDDGEEV